MKKKKPIRFGDKTVSKPTLSQRMERLEKIVINGFKQVNTRIDNIERRLDNVDTRLDYNNLKKLPNSR